MAHFFKKNDKSVHGVLGIQTRGGTMVGKEKSIKLWRQHLILFTIFLFHFSLKQVRSAIKMVMTSFNSSKR